MNLETRLEILHSSSVIDTDTKDIMMKIINMFKDKYNIILTEENASMMITHISMAIMRVKKNEDIKSIDVSAYQEVLENENYKKVLEIYDDILSISNISFPEDEKKYILVNICVILENI
ncbi:PRD domain-containing protein [Brachyspira pilosicoli]|uniref:PRD domain-containing protein n=1 Tax=Brachyspira pilosicoli TaxID=52584 RepID=A0A5C8F5X9_BRAPL|nr:PRD domain-containing protein [Brachyspira pilosicoli]TXJ45193.1 PRD domain-containing protein [Brachyspira pilosicoli]